MEEPNGIEPPVEMQVEAVTPGKPTPGMPGEFISLDDSDRALLKPLVDEIQAGKRAEKLLDQIVGMLKRRTGFDGGHAIIDADCRRIAIVRTEGKK